MLSLGCLLDLIKSLMHEEDKDYVDTVWNIRTIRQELNSTDYDVVAREIKRNLTLATVMQYTAELPGNKEVKETQLSLFHKISDSLSISPKAVLDRQQTT